MPCVNANGRLLTGMPVLAGSCRLAVSAVLAVALFFVAGCKSGNSTHTRTKTGSGSATNTLSGADWESRAKAHAAFAAGLLRGINNDMEGLLSYFEKAYDSDPSNMDLAMDVARRRLQAGQIEKAMPILDKAAARPEAPGDIHSMRGIALIQQGKGDEALQAYLKAIERPPVLPSVFQSVVRMLAGRKRGAEALAILDRSSKNATNGPASLLEFADLYLLAGVSDPALTNRVTTNAIALLDKARALKSDDAAINLRLADRYSSLGRTADSEAVLRGFQEQAPKNPAAISRLAEMYLRSGRIPEAASQLEALRKIDPSNPMTYYFLGVIAMEEKQYEKARNHFERAILLNPGFEPAHGDLALALLNLERPEDSVAILDRARRDFAPSFRIEYLAGVANAQLKKYDDSFRHYQAAETLGATNQPPLTDHRFYFQVGAMLERKGDEIRCIEYLEKSLELEPDYDEALNHLGYLWAEKGENLDRARAMIEVALKAEPENPAYLDSMGWVLFKLGKPAEALVFLEKANKLMPQPDSTVLDHLGDAYAAAGRWDDARKTWAASVKVEASEKVSKKLNDAAGK